MNAERRETLSLDLWRRYDVAHADLVKARRAVREGRASQEEVDDLEAALQDVQLELEQLGHAPSDG